MELGGLRTHARGRAIGALWLTLYGAIASAAVLGFGATPPPVVLVEVGLIPVFLWGIGIVLLRASLRPPRAAVPTPRLTMSRGTARQLGLVFSTYLVSVLVVNTICYLLHHVEFIIPIDVLIVGAHFVPLARIFHVPHYYGTGLVVTSAAVFTLAATSPATTIAQTSAWVAIPLLGSAAALWLTALAMLVESVLVLRRARAKPGRDPADSDFTERR